MKTTFLCAVICTFLCFSKSNAQDIQKTTDADGNVSIKMSFSASDLQSGKKIDYEKILSGEDESVITTTYTDTNGTSWTITGGSKAFNRVSFGVQTKKKNCLADNEEEQYKKFGYLDSSGRWAIQPIFDNVSEFGDDGLATVSVCDNTGQYNQWHIRPDGKRLYPQKYVDVNDFYNGYAIVDKDGAYHMCHIDKTGRPLYLQTYQWLWNYNENGRAIAIRNINLTKDTCVWVVIDTTGKELFVKADKYGDVDPPDVVYDHL